MARRDPPRGGGKLRLMAGFSVVLGSIAVLLAIQSRPAPLAAGRGAPATPPSPEAVHDGFEPRDANARSVGIVMAVGAGAIALSIVGLFLMLGVLHRQQQGVPLTPQQRATIVPPGPPLQSNPDRNLAALQARESAMLTQYRWLAPDHKTAQIPIERAMALVAGKSLDPAP